MIEVRGTLLAEEVVEPVTPPPTRLARMLALSWLVDELVESGLLAGYSEAARRLGVSRTRMCQIARLRFLAPGIQERVLAGELRVSERGVRGTAGVAGWEEQERVLANP